MRTISGKVVSSEAISLTRAASILSNFVTSDHGSSHAVRSYLRRTSASFDDLANLHKELKHSVKSQNSEVQHKKKKRDRAEHSVVDDDLSNESKKVLIGEIEDGGNVEAKKKKKKKRKGSEL